MTSRLATLPHGHLLSVQSEPLSDHAGGNSSIALASCGKWGEVCCRHEPHAVSKWPYVKASHTRPRTGASKIPLTMMVIVSEIKHLCVVCWGWGGVERGCNFSYFRRRNLCGFEGHMLVKCLWDAAFLSASWSIIYIGTEGKNLIFMHTNVLFCHSAPQRLEKMLCISANIRC